MTPSWIEKMQEKRRNRKEKKATRKTLKNASGPKESGKKVDFWCNFPEKVDCATMFDSLD